MVYFISLEFVPHELFPFTIVTKYADKSRSGNFQMLLLNNLQVNDTCVIILEEGLHRLSQFPDQFEFINNICINQLN